MKKLIITAICFCLMLCSCSSLKKTPEVFQLTKEQRIQMQEKTLMESLLHEMGEKDYYQKGLDALDEGSLLSAKAMFRIVVEMKGEKAEKARNFTNSIQRDLEFRRKFWQVSQDDIKRHYNNNLDPDIIKVKVIISNFLSDSEIPKNLSIFIGRLYKGLLKEGLTETQAISILSGWNMNYNP